MDTVRKQDEIDNLMNEVIEAESNGGSKFPGMTYEQGIRAAIDWLEGRAENPMEE